MNKKSLPMRARVAIKVQDQADAVVNVQARLEVRNQIFRQVTDPMYNKLSVLDAIYFEVERKFEL